MLNVSPELIEAFNPNNGNGPRSVDYSFMFSLVSEEALEHQTPAATLYNDQLTRIEQTVRRTTAMAQYISLEFGGWPLDGSRLIPPTGARNRNDYYITLENYGWPLDGSGVVPPHTYEHGGVQIGMISGILSDAEGYFPAPAPTYTIDFGAYPQKLLAVTLDLGATILADLDVALYNSSLALIKTVNIRDNESAEVTVNLGVDGVQKLVITPVRSVLPYRSFRIRHFYPGSDYMFSKTNAHSIALTLSCNILGERVEAGSLRVRCPNFSDKYDITDPQGIFAYFKDWQELTGRIGAQVLEEIDLYEYMPIGYYFVNASKFENNYRTLVFEATDIVGKVAATKYSLGVIQGDMTVAALIDRLADIAEVEITYPDYFASKIISVFVHKNTELHMLLANVAQLMGCIVRASRYYKNRIEYVDYAQSPVVRILTGADYRMDNGITVADSAKVGQLTLGFSDIAPSGDPPKVLAQINLSEFPGAVLMGYTLYADGVELRFVPSKFNCILDYGTPATNVGAQQSGSVFTVTGTPAVIAEGKSIFGDQTYNHREMARNALVRRKDASRVCEWLYHRMTDKTKEATTNYRGYPYFELGDAIGLFIPEVGLLPPQIVTELRYDLIGGGMTGSIKSKEA